MRGLIRNARLGIIAVVFFLCMRTAILLLSFTGDDDGLPPGVVSRGGFQWGETPDVLSGITDSFTCNANITRPRDDQIHTRHEHWQLLDIDTVRNELLVYSAFYDDRPDVGQIPVIRILAVANKEHAPYFCQIWYNELDQTPHIVKAEELKTGRGDRFRDISYGQYMYTCKLLGAFPVPTHVSMTTQKCQTSSIYLPINRSPKAQWTQEFAICVPIAFGHIAPAFLIDWMELVQMLGVSTVHVYNATLSPILNKFFDYYKEKGLVQVHPMPPAVEAFDVHGAKLGSPASLNDCMLRNLYRYRYIAFIDFDEIIVPKADQNYTAMINDIKHHHRLKEDAISYTFRNVYYFLDFTGDSVEKDYHTILKYRTRLEPSGYLYAAKSFIDPRHCLSVFNHYCYVRFPSAGRHWTVDVDSTIASSQHYRKCNLGADVCEKMFKKNIHDDIMLRYRDKLHNLNQKVLDYLL